ncbi:hypothetical protein SK128_007593 [Halocaridina rubra]|uniref:Uncharacterized protein n=1 Tax=Halocaridina rubra TaxID=373956 RepID=A0AAN8ZTY1_HALRR
MGFTNLVRVWEHLFCDSGKPGISIMPCCENCVCLLFRGRDVYQNAFECMRTVFSICKHRGDEFVIARISNICVTKPVLDKAFTCNIPVRDQFVFHSIEYYYKSS